MITAAEAMSLFDYDAGTGCLSWKGRARIAGTQKPDGSRNVQIHLKMYKAHRLIWLMIYGTWPVGVIDHISGDASDNRIGNLRDVSAKVNTQNMRRAHKTNKSSGVLGVSKNLGKWMASIRIAGIKKNLGRFESIEQASAAYITAKRLHHAGCTL